MESIAPTATFHDTTSLLIDNLDFTIHDDIVVVFHKHGVGFQQLLDGMYTLCLEGVVLHDGVFLGKAFVFVLELLVFECGELCGDVGEHEECVVLHDVGNELVTLVGHLHRLQLLIHHEEQRLNCFWHAAVVVLHVDFLSLQESSLDAWL